MTPEQALAILDNVAAQAQVNRADTHTLEEAVAVLREAISRPPEPES